MQEEIREEISGARDELAKAVQVYFDREYTPAFRLALLYLARDQLKLNMTVPSELLEALEVLSSSFKKRDYQAMAEIAIAVYSDWKLSETDEPSIREVCAFSFNVGVAVGAIARADYDRRVKKKAGGDGRAKKIAEVERLVISKCRELDGWESKSASDLASELIGISGITFKHRKIAETISEYRKQCAMHPAQNT